jgi:hypothetical protein
MRFNLFRKDNEPKAGKVSQSERGGAFGFHFLEPDQKLLNAMDRATEKHDSKGIVGWLKAFAKEDLQEQRRWEKAMKKEYND